MSGINTIGDKETDLLQSRTLFFSRKNEGGEKRFYEYFSNFLTLESEWSCFRIWRNEMHASVCSCDRITSNFEYGACARALVAGLQWNSSTWNVHFPVLFWSDALICPAFHAPHTFSQRAPLAASVQPLYLKCRVDGVYMASECGLLLLLRVP